jgi:hypothetical protein
MATGEVCPGFRPNTGMRRCGGMGALREWANAERWPKEFRYAKLLRQGEALRRGLRQTGSTLRVELVCPLG